MPLADGYEMTEEQAILIILDMLNGMEPPQNVRNKAFRTIILEWLDRQKQTDPMRHHVKHVFPWPKGKGEPK